MNILSYFFSKNPGPQFNYYIPMIILLAILIIGGITLGQIYQSRKKYDFAFKRLFKKTAKRMILLGLLFGILTLTRYENIPYFSMRIWFYISFFLLGWFIYKTVKTYKIEYPKEKENVEKNTHVSSMKKEENKYLPNKKKK